MKRFSNTLQWTAILLLGMAAFLGACNSATEVVANREEVGQVITSIEKLNFSHPTLEFKAGNTTQSMTLVLRNTDSNKTIEVKSIRFATGDKGFSFKNLPTLPAQLKPNTSISIVVHSPSSKQTELADGIIINEDITRKIPVTIAAMSAPPPNMVYVTTADLRFVGSDSFSFVQSVVNGSTNAVKLTDATTALTFSSDGGTTWTNLPLDNYFNVNQAPLQPNSLPFFPGDEYPITFSSKVALNPGLYRLTTTATYSGSFIASVTGVVTLTID